MVPFRCDSRMNIGNVALRPLIAVCAAQSSEGQTYALPAKPRGSKSVALGNFGRHILFPHGSGRRDQDKSLLLDAREAAKRIMEHWAKQVRVSVQRSEERRVGKEC